jgi:dihydroorotase
MSKYDLIIKNVQAILPDGAKIRDIAIKDERIVSIGSSVEEDAKTIIDGTGKILIPGAIDTQVHFREPGLVHKEDLESGSRSAILGGVTSFLEMPNTNPSTTTVDAINHKIDLASSKALSNFAFFIGANSDNLKELQAAKGLKGCCGIKIFLGSSTGDLLLHDAKILTNIFNNVSQVIAVHSECENLLKKKIAIRDNATSAHAHPKWRDVDTAITSTRMIINIAKNTKRKVHVLHITSQEEIEYLAENKAHCTVEVTPQHLTLSAPKCYDELGTYAQMNPPIREERHREALWRGIENDTVNVIGSDHAPHTKEEKDKGYPDSPSGMPGVQTILPLLFHHALDGKLTIEKMVDLLCHHPADLYGIIDRGRIVENAIADLVILDPNKETIIKNENMASKCGWTPFHDWTLKGHLEMVILAGSTVVKEGKITGQQLGRPLEFQI